MDELLNRVRVAVLRRTIETTDVPSVAELAAELSRGEWRDRVLPRGQLQRLRSILRDHAHPPAWGAAAVLLLDFFVSGRA